MIEIPNSQRALIRILSDLTQERQIQMETFSYDWVVRLAKGAIVTHIVGYNFGLNTAAAQMIADDKGAVSDLLQYNQIPHVPHQLFLNPQLTRYVGGRGSWATMIAFAQRYDYHVVCKPNEGTGGSQVFQVTTQLALEQAVHTLFQSNRAICLSPFYPIEQEYRVIVVQERCELVYAKRRPTIVGNGRSSLIELIASQVSAGQLSPTVAAAAIKSNVSQLQEVLAAGQPLPLNWKHNLGLGAYPDVVTDQDLTARLSRLALDCAAALGIVFASIDIIKTADQYLVLEVNAGVMMESFVRLRPDGYDQARRIYARAVDLLFPPPAS